MNNNLNKWGSSNIDNGGSWNDIPLLKIHRELEALRNGIPNTNDHRTTSGRIADEIAFMSSNNKMGTDTYSKDSYDAKSKITGALNKGKNVCDTFPRFNNTKSARDLPKEHALAAASVSNVDPEYGLPKANDLMWSTLLSNEDFISKILDTSKAAMDELFVKATKGTPLWMSNEDGTESLNEIEYWKEFQSDDLSIENLAKLLEAVENASHGANIEVTREFGFVPMLRADIVNMLMNCEKWAANFCNVVSRATMLGVLSSGRENHDGTLLMLTAEFHTASSLIPSRKSYLARYCRQLDQYTWGVVDISVENLIPDCPAAKFQRKPSGCLIVEIPDKISSNVAWVEHCLADHRAVHYDVKHIVDAGIGFGARYWHSALSRYAHWCNVVRATRSLISNYRESMAQEGRMSLLRLGERLLRNFFIDRSPSKDSIWMPSTLFDAKSITLRRSKYNGVKSRLVNGGTIVFASSFKLPVSPRRVFDHLRHENNRPKWDILSRERNTRALIYVPTSESSDQNFISIIEVSGTGDSNVTYYLQNAYRDEANAYVVYAPMDRPTVHHLLIGGDPDIVMILPSGFTVLPDKLTPFWRESEGCLVTAGFHIMDTPTTGNANQISAESLEFVQKIVSKTVEALISSLYSNPPSGH